MPTKMPDSFVGPKRKRTGPMTVHYNLLAADLDGWYSFDRKDVGLCEAAFKSKLHNGARTRGLRAHVGVDHDVLGGVIACYYDPEDS